MYRPICRRALLENLLGRYGEIFGMLQGSSGGKVIHGPVCRKVNRTSLIEERRTPFAGWHPAAKSEFVCFMHSYAASVSSLHDLIRESWSCSGI